MAASHTLTEADLAALVDRFYEKVQRDPELGPVFNPAVHDWDEHKATLVDFWSSVVLRTGRYRGNPMAMHRPHPIDAAHFGSVATTSGARPVGFAASGAPMHT